MGGGHQVCGFLAESAFLQKAQNTASGLLTNPMPFNMIAVATHATAAATAVANRVGRGQQRCRIRANGGRAFYHQTLTEVSDKKQLALFCCFLSHFCPTPSKPSFDLSLEGGDLRELAYAAGPLSAHAASFIASLCRVVLSIITMRSLVSSRLTHVNHVACDTLRGAFYFLIFWQTTLSHAASPSAPASHHSLRGNSVAFAAAGNVSLRTSSGFIIGRSRADRMTTVKASAGGSVVAAADAAAAEPPAPSGSGFVWKGAKIVPALLSIAVGVAVKFLIPCPAGVLPEAWTLLAIFLSTITGLVLTPLPVGAWAFCGLSMTVITKTLTFQQAFSAMTNDVIWLIVLAFFFAKGFVQTGLGDRVATFFVKILGKSTLGLSYGLTISEALLAPAMPSTTARAGGVYLPIIKSLVRNGMGSGGGRLSPPLPSHLASDVSSVIQKWLYRP